MISSPKAKAVRFDDRYLHVELVDQRIISAPLAWFAPLLQATLPQLANYKLICQRTGIEWPDLDYHLSIEGLLQGHLGVRAA